MPPGIELTVAGVTTDSPPFTIRGGVAASTARVTAIAPASRSAAAHARAVAPVVTTSSTRRTRPRHEPVVHEPNTRKPILPTPPDLGPIVDAAEPGCHCDVEAYGQAASDEIRQVVSPRTQPSAMRWNGNDGVDLLRFHGAHKCSGERPERLPSILKFELDEKIAAEIVISEDSDHTIDVGSQVRRHRWGQQQTTASA